VAGREWGKYKINVNCICPYAVTPLLQQWAEDFPEKYSERVQRIPMQRVGDCENDIGRVAVFLSSQDSNYITCHTLMVDGGLYILR
jgi:NAD(P)-dependent dehydrogenase (short-subunit alcohol dehydrogenase family)